MEGMSELGLQDTGLSQGRGEGMCRGHSMYKVVHLLHLLIQIGCQALSLLYSRGDRH